MNKIVENTLYIVIGIFVLFILDFKILELPELFTILVSFIGFAAILHGGFEFISIRSELIKKIKSYLSPYIKEYKEIRFCIECGTEIEDNADFCSNCGQEIHPYQEKITEESTGKSKFDHGENIKFYEKDDLDTKVDNLEDLADELREENIQLKEELKKYR